jgi:lipopolysaccharide/colanic/teichoic acid biosynthesis glycosyltransferase
MATPASLSRSAPEADHSPSAAADGTAAPAAPRRVTPSLRWASPRAARFKRGLDVAASATALLVLSPVLAAIAVAVKRDSSGPVLYVDWRIGRDQRPFRCYKFRTMCEDAPQRQCDLEGINECGGVLFKIREDPRVTRVGLKLRKYSLDELPQLFNILRGDMSLVGPRPLPTRDVERMDDWHLQRHLVTPGLTGLWQVNGRSKLDFDDMIRLDLDYIEDWTPLADLVIIARTARSVLASDGAY